jgi:hypothetical protein
MIQRMMLLGKACSSGWFDQEFVVKVVKGEVGNVGGDDI